MTPSRIRQRSYSKLTFGDPKGFLTALHPLEVAVSMTNLPPRVKNLRTNSLKSQRERIDAAIFCVGMSQALGLEVRFSMVEEQDHDFVATWSDSQTQHFVPVQLKELVAAELNPEASITSLFGKLTQYADCDDLAVAIKWNRPARFEPSQVEVPSGVRVGEIWIFAAIAPDQSKWGLWGDFVRGGVENGIVFEIPR